MDSSLLSSLAQAAASRHLLLSVWGPPSPCSICPAGSLWRLCTVRPTAGPQQVQDASQARRLFCSPPPAHLRIPGVSDVSMTTRALQELDGGLGSCQAGQDLSTLADPCPDQPLEDRARATPRLADSSSWSHDSQEPAAEGSPTGNVDARPKKTEKEPVTKVALGAGKERLKAGATPRSPARKKAQAAPPPQRPPPPPAPAPALSEELPWGDLSLNKCLVLASLLAMLGSAFQLCRDAVAGEAGTPAPVPEPWVPPRSAPEPASPRPPPPAWQPKPEAWVPPSGPPAPQVEAEEKAEVPGSREAADKAAGEERAPKETPRKEERPRRERPPKEQRPPKERPRREERARKQEKPRAAREPRGALPRRWEAGEGGRRPWTQDSGDPGRRKRQAWGSPRRPDEDRPPGRQKQRAGKGRD
ncbi:junctional sarcoplasmic reticulum protein 1 isoform X3 [Panthera leo]|uniref:junctional sarcoplasmic reticulum protein 1 isoform X3 n=1 Tax=Panthera leo TaxID=9689 RepID=UPI001C6987BE|nr:junctional sarcoplasmic reticulum protein 1 isoform X3 [Panthera leo]